MSKSTVAIVVLIALIGGLAYWAIDIKFKQVEINAGFNQEARRNPFLAAQLFMAELNPKLSPELENTNDITDKRFETQQGLDKLKQLPKVEDTLIITSARNTVTNMQSQALLQWVEQGGHLIIRASQEFNRQQKTSGDHILDAVDIRLHPFTTSAEDSNDENKDSEQESNDLEDLATTIGEQLEKMNADHLSCDAAEDVNLSSFPTEPDLADAQAHIKSPNILEYDNLDDAAFWTSDGYGPQLIQLNLGQGKLSVMTDMDLWHNRNIGCFDNAYVLQHLVNSHNSGQSGKTWLLYHEKMPSFSSLLWKYHRALIVSSMLLLFIWVWSQTLRFGPLKIINSAIRRQFSEHIEATTRYRFKAKQGEEIIDLVRQQLFSQVSKRHNDFEKMSQQQQIELIARLSETEPDQVYFALYNDFNSKPEQVIKQVQDLQIIRKQLC
jgi:hypothetical protein